MQTLKSGLLIDRIIAVIATALLAASTAAAAPPPDLGRPDVRDPPPPTARGELATYHDVAAMDAAILLFDGVGGRMRVHEIGRTWAGRPVRGVHISATPNLYNTGAEASMAVKPALLIECGMHAREWAGPELCLKYLQVFSLSFLLDRDRINDILVNADIWVIPMVNPDGRATDDKAGGDPNDYDTSGDSRGWRPNRQPVFCDTKGFPEATVGIDIARSFSRDWLSAQPSCTSSDFRGEAPFHAIEAQILRRFVENRMISMSLSVHSYAQTLSIQTPSLNAIRSNAINLWNAQVPSLPLSAGASGGRNGQFPGWMANPADTPSQPDFGTSRGAVALLVELPPTDSRIPGVKPTYVAPYRYSPTDRSNEFHPSGKALLDESLQGFVAAVHYLAEQTRRPWCPLTPGTLAPSPACKRDVGITGAKIAVCVDCVGTLNESPFGLGSRQTKKPGSSHIVYRVQNFDSTTAANLQVTVSVSSRPIGSVPYTTDLTSAAPFTLASGAAATGSVPFTFVAGRDYRVSINATPTSYSGETNTQNNSRLFRFIVQ